MTSTPCRLTLTFACAALLCCAKANEAPRDLRFAGTAAVKVTPAETGTWLLVLETLQPQVLVTSPIRSAALVGDRLIRTYDAPPGWILLDASAHPSGDVSLLSVRGDGANYPLRVLLSRASAGGAVVERELTRLVPDGPEPPPEFLSSLDRARIVAHGEDLFALVRWANNAVQAYRLDSALEESWASWVEPAAPLLFIGIIGGGFDNFHQGDSSSFVYADADADANLYVAVASTPEVLANHDAFFGEHLGALADPGNFDFGTAIATRFDAQGTRTFARLHGVPGRNKRLLNLRVAGGSVLLVGRIKTGNQPGNWDGWIHSSRGATGEVEYERTIDVQSGDMFWDAAPLGDGRVLAVGSTNYTQNPSGLSVSDARDALALVLDANGNVLDRIPLPAGPAGRGNEATSASVEGNRMAISGILNAPGTHAEIFSDAFLVVQ